MQQRRDRLAGGLEKLGLAVLPCEATYFLNLDLDTSPPLPEPEEGTHGVARDLRACEGLTEKAGAAAIPISAFCIEQPVTNVVRLCFANDLSP